MTKKNTKISSDELAETIIQGIQERKGEEIVKIDLKEVDGAVTDYFIICQANSTTQVVAIKDSIEEFVRKNVGEKPWHVEGTANAEWVLLDYVDVVAHIFLPERREYFNLEGLWADAEILEVESEN
ncbi:MAG: ribosome silencing factor [Flavobacteriales bacterium]|nr:ribosome silencing factor [Flavobacteriales bacterium]|tara:strand:- start:11652 stop:12029 length:378 start_codon:yes stop_codon:yes gene_type:complete